MPVASIVTRFLFTKEELFSLIFHEIPHPMFGDVLQLEFVTEYI